MVEFYDVSKTYESPALTRDRPKPLFPDSIRRGLRNLWRERR